MTTRIAVTLVGCLAVLATALYAPTGAAAQADSCANAELRTGASAGLPDCRALELVSPAQKVGGTGVGVWYNGPNVVSFAGHAAYEGERFAVRGDWGSVLTNGGFAFANDWALAERTPTGWASKPAATRGGYGSQDYRFLFLAAASDDLETTAWNSNGGLLRLFPELEPWDEGRAGNPTFMRGWASDRWDLFAPTAPEQNELQSSAPAISALGVSGDGRYALGSGPVRGVSGPGDPTHPSWPDYHPKSGNVYLFDLSEGFTDAFPAPDDERRVLVSSCTAGTEVPLRSAGGELGAQPCSSVAPGRPAMVSPRGASLNGNRAARAISHDGSRGFFVSPSTRSDAFAVPPVGPPSACGGEGPTTACPPQLYVRQRRPDGTVATTWISRPRSVPAGEGAFGSGLIAGQDASLLGRVVFEGASRDGSRVFFRTPSPLTPDDPNGGCGAPCLSGTPSAGSWDLYMYELPGGPDGDSSTPDGDPGAGTLTRISAGPDGDADCNSPFPSSAANDNGHGGARFVSDDGGRVYFVCAGPIGGPGAPWNDGPAGGTTAPAGAPSTQDTTNLYLYDAASPPGERWRFVALLPRATTGTNIDACASMAARPGSVLLGGLADVNLPAPSSPRDCVRGAADGGLVSFMTLGQLTGDDGDGAADVYGYDAVEHRLVRISAPAAGAAGGAYACGSGLCNADTGIGPEGTVLPDAAPMLTVASDPSHGGDPMVFFESRSRLVPDDVDDGYDLYRWRDGELALVSRWVSDTDGAFFLGADRSGRNVFFASRDRLTWEDRDAVLDVYTARVDGGIPQPPDPPTPCDPVVDLCRGAGGGAPVAVGPTGTSSAEHGRGNVSAVRVRLRLRGLSRVQRRRAARRGVLAVRVRVSRPGRVTVVARARLGKRVRRVGRARRRIRRAGSAALRVRLNRGARRRLRAGRRLPLRVVARMPEAPRQAITFALRRTGR